MRNLTHEERLATLRLQSLQHRRLFNDLLLAFKALHSFTVQPESLELNVRDITMTRSCVRQFIHCKPKSSQLSKSFMCRLPIEWDKLPSCARTANFISVFKNLLMNYITLQRLFLLNVICTCNFTLIFLV